MSCRYVIKGHHPPIALLCRLRRLLSTEAKAKVDNSLGDLHNSSHHMKAEFIFIHSFIHYPQAPLVWSTFGTPAFISAQTSSKFHATPLTDLNEFAMNNRYLGHSDWDLIWHVVYRGQIKYFFSEGTEEMAICGRDQNIIRTKIIHYHIQVM